MFVNLDIENKAGTDSIRIINVEADMRDDGKEAIIHYAMPENDDYRYCFIYEVSETEFDSMKQRNMILSELIQSERKFDIIDKRTPRDYTVKLTGDGVRCLLYPARYDQENNVYYLLDQKQENFTGNLKLKPTFFYSVQYESVRTGLFKLFSTDSQKAIIKIYGTNPINGSSLNYRCRGGGRDSIVFGIDISRFLNKNCEITIKKNEQIEVLQPKNETFLLQKR